MTEVLIKNKELLKTLDSFKDELFSIDGVRDPIHHMWEPSDAKERGLYYTSEEYLRDVWFKKYNDHTGFPQEHFSQPVGNMGEKNPEKFYALAYKVKKEFPAFIGTHSNALFNYYPPGGFVGWHTNWNAAAYQILFTWSETGDGYFRYYDRETDSIVNHEDKPGWQCRWYRFGRYSEPQYHCWHAAYAGCDRITLAYKFINGPRELSNAYDEEYDRQAIAMRDAVIDDIETE